MDVPNRLLPSVLSALCFGAVFAAAPAVAQPGASWIESGDVLITTFNDGEFGGREAEDVLESDVIWRIEVGDGGLVANQDSGTLRIEGVGTTVTPRDLREVSVPIGRLELNGSFVDGTIDLGASVQTQFTDPSVGDMTTLLSGAEDTINVGNGTLSAQLSRLADVRVGSLGRALLSNCQIGYVSGVSSGYTEIDASTIDGNGNWGGTMFVTNSTIAGGSYIVARDGDFQIGPLTNWDTLGEIEIGGNSKTTELLVNSSTIESGTAEVLPMTDVEMQGASLWRSFGLFRIVTVPGAFEINSASRIEARTDLYIGRALVTISSGVGTDSRIDVDGDLELGWTGTQATDGTLTIEDGGVVAVDGTLTIRPLATLNLNGGTLRVGVLDNQGTLNENGGTLIVPEPVMPAFAALLALALVARRHRGIRR